MLVKRLNPESLAPPVMGLYAQIVVSSAPKLAFIAGQVGMDRNGAMVGEDHATQARQAFRNISLAVQAVGAVPGNIVKMTVYVVRHTPDLIEPIFNAGREVFGAEWPLTACVLAGVQALGVPEWLIEIDAIVAVAP